MKNFADFSRDSFLSFVKNLKGFVCYKNTDKRIIYANRFGEVYKWSNHGDEIVTKKLDYGRPNKLTMDDIMWLKGVATKKHWYGGVDKLDQYSETPYVELEEKGIDPYFYAWMASRHYHKVDETQDEIPSLITEGEYDTLKSALGIIFDDKDDELDGFFVQNFIACKLNDGQSVTTFITSVADNADSRSDLSMEVANLVDRFLPNMDVTSSIALKRQIVNLLVENGAKK